jgi:tetrahydromethanopterin S-methyltransferase subunit E
MDHFCGLIFGLIAFLKLCAAAALIVLNADKGTYSVIKGFLFVLPLLTDGRPDESRGRPSVRQRRFSL